MFSENKLVIDIVSGCSVHTKQSKRTRHDMSFHLPTSVSPPPPRPLPCPPCCPPCKPPPFPFALNSCIPLCNPRPQQICQCPPPCPPALPPPGLSPLYALGSVMANPHRVPLLVSRAPRRALVCVSLDVQSSARHPAVYPVTLRAPHASFVRRALRPVHPSVTRAVRSRALRKNIRMKIHPTGKYVQLINRCSYMVR